MKTVDDNVSEWIQRLVILSLVLFLPYTIYLHRQFPQLNTLSLTWLVSGYFWLGLMSSQADFVAWSTCFREQMADHERRIF